jgi:hypothetical protein
MKMQSLTFQRELAKKRTMLTATGPLAEIRLEIRGRLCPRQRRAIAIQFFRQLRPWLELLENTRIHHLEDDHFHFERERLRGVKLFQHRNLGSPATALGFKIRMQRLEGGYTLHQLARKAEIHPGHLSEIERGLHLPRRGVRRKLEAAFELPGFLDAG